MCFHPNKLGEAFVDLSVLKDPSFFILPPPPPPPLGPPVLISHLHILRSMVLDLMACSCWSKVFSRRSCYPVMVITQVKFPLTRFAFARFTFYLDKFCKFWINFPWPVFPWPNFPWPNFPWPIFPWPIFPWPIISLAIISLAIISLANLSEYRLLCILYSTIVHILSFINYAEYKCVPLEINNGDVNISIIDKYNFFLAKSNYRLFVV